MRKGLLLRFTFYTIHIFNKQAGHLKNALIITNTVVSIVTKVINSFLGGSLPRCLVNVVVILNNDYPIKIISEILIAQEVACRDMRKLVIMFCMYCYKTFLCTFRNDIYTDQKLKFSCCATL